MNEGMHCSVAMRSLMIFGRDVLRDASLSGVQV
jgi:hypothetical protein